MKLTSIVAIYFLFWVMSAMLVLPFGVRTHQEEGVEMIPGQATSAPVRFDPRKVAKRATLLAAVLFGLYYLNYVQGWVTLKDIDITSYL